MHNKLLLIANILVGLLTTPLMASTEETEAERKAVNALGFNRDYPCEPHYFEKYPNLKKLSFQEIAVPDFVWDYQNLENIEDIHILNAPYLSIPDKISQMRNLKELTAQNCGLNSINPAIYELTNLKDLIL